MIIYTVLDVEMPIFKKNRIKNWIKKIAGNYNKTIGDIAYIFCSRKKIFDLNKQYLNHNYITDILTFDYSIKNRISGDIFISIDTVRTNSKSLHTDYENELYRVMIHGILHLCGIKDNTTEDQIQMRNSENKALEYLSDLQNSLSLSL